MTLTEWPTLSVSPLLHLYNVDENTHLMVDLLLIILNKIKPLSPEQPLDKG